MIHIRHTYACVLFMYVIYVIYMYIYTLINMPHNKALYDELGDEMEDKNYTIFIKMRCNIYTRMHLLTHITTNTYTHPYTLLHTPTQKLHTSTHSYTPLHTSTYPYTPLHTPTHLYTPLHTPTHPYTPLHTPTHLPS